MTQSLVREVGAEATAPRMRAGRRALGGPHVLVALAGLVALVANIAVLDRMDASVEVLAAEGPLTRGMTLTAADVHTVAVAADATALAGLLPAAELGEHVGAVVARDLPAGALLRADDVADPSQPTGAAMSLPIEVAHAAGGDLRPGDRVDVVVVAQGRASYAARDLEVLAVGGGEDRGLALSGNFHVTVAVPESLVLDLASALHADGLELVRTSTP